MKPSRVRSITLARRLVAGLLSATSVVLLAGCSLILNPDPPNGPPPPTGDPRFGLRCSSDNGCGPGESCQSNRCTTMCSATAACAGGGIAECGGDGYCSFLTPPPIEGTLDVGYLYVGPVGDFGWTATHEVGRQFVQAELPDVRTHFAPFITTADAPAKIEEFLTLGPDGMEATGDEDDVVIATSFDFLAPMQAAALQHDDRNFLGCALFTDGPNLGSYFARMEQVMYLGGRLAAQVTQNKKICIIGPVTIPETVRHINAFTQGVRSAPTGSDSEVIVRWTGAWFNPDEEILATTELIAAGCDIIYGQTDTRVPQEYIRDMNLRTECPEGAPASCMAADCETDPTADLCDGRRIYTFGHDNPTACDGDPNCLASLGYNWGPMLVRILESMRNGTWRPDQHIWEQVKDDPSSSAVYLTQINQDLVPSSVRFDVEGIIPMLSAPSGTYLQFRGPISDNTGMLRVRAGESATDDQMLRMCWFVNGVYDVSGEPAVVPAGCPGDT